MVDHAMVINTPSGLPGIRNMGFAKQPRVPSNLVLPYLITGIDLVSFKERLWLSFFPYYDKHDKKLVNHLHYIFLAMKLNDS